MSSTASSFLFALAVPAVLHSGAEKWRWQELDRFFALLRREGISLSDAEASDTMLVLGRWPSHTHSASLRAYVANGRTLIVASECPSAGAVLRHFNLRLSRNIVLLWRKRFCFLGQPDCPLVRPVEAFPSLCEGVRAVATNRARAVRGRGTVLARFPDPFLFADLFSEPKAFARALYFGRGRVIALGDQSLFINLMLPEEDNTAFVRNLLRWCRTRSLCLWRDGQQVRSFKERRTVREAPLPRRVSLPPLAPTLRDFNLLVGDIQRSLSPRRLNRRLLPVMLLGGGFILFLLLLREIAHTYIPSRRRPSGRVPRADRRLLAVRLLAFADAGSGPTLLKRALKARRHRRFQKFLRTLFSGRNLSQRKGTL